MKKSILKDILLVGVSTTLVASLAVGGTLAYLANTDSDVNVMTMGNVQIEQLEYERVVDENGDWVESKYTGYGYTADEMQEFTQGKPALPAVYQDGDVKWDDRNGSQAESGETSHQQPWAQVKAPGSNQLFDDSVKNVIDKFVFVKNTGKTNAYYRTIIAVESPEENTAEIHLNRNGNSRFTWDMQLGHTEIDGVRYALYVATYNEVLIPNEVSRPSLLQVFLDPTATNEDCAAFGDTWEILVVSQAVQADDFESAENALNEVFGEITTENHPWNDGVSNAKLPGYVYNYEELAAALAKGGDIKLGADIVLDADDYMSITSKGHQRRLLVQDVTVTLDLNGYTIDVDGGGYTIYANGDTNLTVKDSVGTGAIISNSDDRMMGINGNAYVTIENGVFKNTRTEVCGYNGFSTWGNSTLKIYGGTFDIPSAGNGDGSGLQWLLHNYNGRYQGSTIGIEVFGGKFVNHDLSKGTAGTNYYGDRFDLVNPAYKCVKTDVDENGNTWYEVVPAASITNNQELDDAIADGANELNLIAGTYQMPASAKGKTLTINGVGPETVIEIVPAGQGEANGQLDYNLDGSTVTFNNVTIKTNSNLYAGYARLSGTYNNCVIQNTYNLGTGNSAFYDCTINITNEYLRVGGAYSAIFDRCTFNTDGRAILVFQDGTSVDQTVTVKDCTFNATAAANTWNGIHVAAVSIDGTNGTYVVNLEGNNTVDSDFNGLWQIKAGEVNVTVNE